MPFGTYADAGDWTDTDSFLIKTAAGTREAFFSQMATYLAPRLGLATITASEDLAARDLVNIWSSAGAARARKADADDPLKDAWGYVLAAVSSGNPALVLPIGLITGFSGLTDGAEYFLSSTAGGVTDTAPTGAGKIQQSIGRAVGDTAILFVRGEPLELS